MILAILIVTEMIIWLIAVRITLIILIPPKQDENNEELETNDNIYWKQLKIS